MFMTLTTNGSSTDILLLSFSIFCTFAMTQNDCYQNVTNPDNGIGGKCTVDRNVSENSHYGEECRGFHSNFKVTEQSAWTVEEMKSSNQGNISLMLILAVFTVENIQSLLKYELMDD